MEKTDQKVREILADVTERGIQVSEKEVVLALQMKMAEQGLVLGELRNRWGQGFRPNASKDVLAVLAMIAPDYRFKSASKDFMVPYILKHQENAELQKWGSLIIRGKELSRAVSVLQKLWERVRFDDVLHPEFNDEGETGRIYSEMNTWSKLARACVFAPEGQKVMYVDWKAHELRILASLSNDEPLKEDFRNDVDPHKSAYSAVTGNICESDIQREKGKVINYSMIYGVDPDSMARKLGVAKEVADAAINRYFKSHPGVAMFRLNTEVKAQETGMVETFYGRKRDLGPFWKAVEEGTWEKFNRKAVNTRIQGTAADFLRLAMVEITERKNAGGLRWDLVCPVHDGFVSFVDEDSAEIEALVKDAMQITFNGVQFPIEVKYGISWGECMDAEEEIEE